MSSGQRRVFFNSRERVISDDHNTAQSYIAKDRAQMMRRLYNRPSTDRVGTINPGLYRDLVALPGAATAGTVHDCYSGLMVRPDAGSYLTVDPGEAGFVVPAWAGSTSEDSTYIIIDSEGLGTAGTLAFTPSPTFPRIDVVECRPIESADANLPRDIIQPDGTVASVNVDKLISGKLSFRIRLGTPDAGFPSVEQTWMPLAVIVTHPGAASFAACDIYDVRPLVGERTDAYWSHQAPPDGTVAATNAAVYERSVAPSFTNPSTAYGWWMGEAAGYRVGGCIWRNVASPTGFGVDGDFDFFDSSLPANRGVGPMAPSVTTGELNCLMAVYPMGLPRWVRYSQATLGAGPIAGQVTTSGRLPSGSNGILVLGRPNGLTVKGECVFEGLPAAYGAGAATGQHRALVVGWAMGLAGNYVFASSAGKTHMLGGEFAFHPLAMTVETALPAASVVLGATLTPQTDVTNLTLATQPQRFPNSAAKLICRLLSSYTATAGPAVLSQEGPYVRRAAADAQIQWYEGSANQRIQFETGFPAVATTTATIVTQRANRPNQTTRSSTLVRADAVSVGTTIATVVAADLALVGWVDY